MKQAESLSKNGIRWTVTAPLALSMLVASLGTSVANIALPALAEAFGASFARIQWVTSAYLAAMTLSTVAAGSLGDTYGHRRVLTAGLALFALASSLTGMAASLPALVGARILQGVGAGVLATLSMALMREVSTEKGVGRAMGLLGTVSAAGTALGPTLGGLVLPLTGWRGAFLAQVPLAVAALVLALTALPAARGERSAMSPNPTALFDRALVPTLATNFLVAAVMMSTLVAGPFCLGLGLGVDAAVVGAVMSIGPLMAMFTGAPSGRLVDAWGAPRSASAGLLLLAAGTLLLAFLPAVVGVGGYVVAIVVLTPGYQLVQAANSTSALTRVAQEHRGRASGLLALTRNAGLMAGAAATGVLFALGAGGNPSGAGPAAIMGGMRLTFLAGGGLIVAAFAFARRGPRQHRVEHAVSGGGEG